MIDWVPENAVRLLTRVTVILVLGTLALKVTRQRRPSVAIVIARAMMVALWVGPIVVLSPWTLGIAMLPATVTNAVVSTGPILDESPSSVSATPANAEQHPTVSHGETRIGNSSPTLENPFVETAITPSVDEIMVKDNQSSIAIDVAVESAVPPGEVATVMPSNPTTKIRISRSQWSAWQMISLVWSIVAGWLFACFIIKAAGTWRLIRCSCRPDDRIVSAINRVATQLRTVTPTVRLSHQVAGPCTAGWFRPIVLLPAAWADHWSEQELAIILAHEFSHADSRDSAWDALAQLARCLWWFHPLAALLVRHHRLACEHRCDATAAQFADDTHDYRARLARWALQLRGCQQERVPAALAMADRPLLIQRLRWLKERGQITGLTTRQRLSACLICLVVFVVTCVVQPTRRLSAAPQPPATDAPQVSEDDTLEEGRTNDSDSPKTMPVLGRLSGVIVSGAEPLDVDWADIRKLPVTVVDEDNRPLKNAKVNLGGFSDKRGADATMEIIDGVQTDHRGIAQVMIPHRTARVFLLASAPGYARQQNNFNTTGKIEFRLQPGRTITVRATNTEGNLLPDACPIVDNSNFLGREFKPQGDGTHLSPVLGAKRRWMRVADASREDGVILFSELIDLNRDDLVGKNGFINPVLKPGVGLEGRLDDSVARPVKQGFVELMISEGQIGPPKGDGVEWQEQVKIKPDGTFVFQSLPRGTHAMLFVLGEGYQSRDPTREQIEAYAKRHGAPSPEVISQSIQRNSPLPWLVHLDEPTTNVTIPCRETAALDVRVVDPYGQPIEGAMATMSPNLYFFGELLIPGMERSTRLEIEPVADRKYRTPDPYMPATMAPIRKLVTDSFLRFKTDKNGIAHFRNIPSLSESFEIESPGYVMAAYPTSTPEAPGRYGLARNLRPGEIVTKTITMERDMPRTTRVLTVIYEGDRPLEDVKVTITDISTSNEDSDWQQWSVQRFGAVSSEKTDNNGRVVLWYPQTVEGKPVQSLRLFMQGNPERDVYFYANLNVPAKADGNVIKFTPEDEPRVSGALRVATPAYVDLASDSDKNAAEVLRMLLREPSLITLRQLLALNKFDAAEPLSLKGERNRISFNGQGPVARIGTEAGWRIVVLTSVRPKGATWVEKPRLNFPPEAAFVFDGKGHLLNMLGGGRSATGDYENIMLANLGTTGDHFLRTSAFESHPPYEYYNRWYRIGAGDKPSLTTYHYANSTSWSGGGGKSDPISEFGYIEYQFNGQDIAQNFPGATGAGVRVPRWVTWDGRRNQFFAEPTQKFDSRSLYQVVLDESAEFVPVGATKETIVATGGRRDYQNWHVWTVTIQDGMDLVARLQRRDADGNTIEMIREDDLPSGLHKFQLHIATNKQAAESTISVMLNAANVKDKTEYTIPPMEIDARPSVEGQAVYVASEPPLRLFDKQLVDEKQSLVWAIENR